MKKKQLIIGLLFLSWFVYNAHRFWNNSPITFTKPFPFDVSYEITWHWYIYMLLKDISYLIILFALRLYVNANFKKDKEIIGAFSAVFFVQIIEIPHYILSARHTEWVLLLEGMILIRSAYRIMTRKC